MQQYIFLHLFFVWMSLEVFSQTHFTEKGYATYYSDIFHGRKTASGQIYNKNEMVCAHKKLPFNSYVKVTNLSNQKTVIVKVIDRGPYGGNGYIIDLSRAAAKELDMLQSGVARVSIELVNKPEKDNTTEKNTNVIKDTTEITSKDKEIKVEKWQTIPGLYDYKGNPQKNTLAYGIQIGFYQNLQSALKTIQSVLDSGYRKVFVQVVQQKEQYFYRIILGNYENEQVTRKNILEIKKKGLNGIVYKF
ncbi:MAG: hypothetical protein KatS3mg035_0465 [Bacteroidia bacterium]|nr:MAG: hypothetical protein KatS3mg035_0465 [Bacteroidia bacterium]